MYIKLLCLSLLLLLGKPDGFAQSAYNLVAPADWTTEKFPLPPAFAPGLQINGTEDIRFSPGWAKKKADGYWTYCFLWKLQDNTPLDLDDLEDCLTKYYTGLVKSNLVRGKVDTVYALPVKVSLHRIVNVSFNKQAYEGRLIMLDYMAQEPIALNLKIHVMRNFVFLEVSPQPFGHLLWQQMDAICRKAR